MDCWPDHSAFSNEGLDGCFYRSGLVASVESGSALVAFYSNHLEDTLLKIEEAGGKIARPIFSFPGGRRFHFCDPAGNEYAVRSDLGM